MRRTTGRMFVRKSSLPRVFWNSTCRKTQCLPDVAGSVDVQNALVVFEHAFARQLQNLPCRPAFLGGHRNLTKTAEAAIHAILVAGREFFLQRDRFIPGLNCGYGNENDPNENPARRGHGGSNRAGKKNKVVCGHKTLDSSPIRGRRDGARVELNGVFLTENGTYALCGICCNLAVFSRGVTCLAKLQTWLPKFAKSNMANVRMNSIGSRRWQQKPHEIEK